MTSLNFFLSGCCGRMGRTIRDVIAERGDDQIVAGFDAKDDPTCPFPIYQDPLLCKESFDVLIDFSSPDALEPLGRLIEQRGCPAVICTTGLDEKQKDKLMALSQIAPIFISANMSLGINLLIDLAKRAAALLYPGFDIEIIEAHHNQKIDAPSGTALMIADRINDVLGGQLKPITDRSQVRQKRGQDELGIHAIRGGTLVGEHTVLFAGPDEVIQIHHSARSRTIFANGAIAAAHFIHGKPAGLYDMDDLLSERISDL